MKKLTTWLITLILVSFVILVPSKVDGLETKKEQAKSHQKRTPSGILYSDLDKVLSDYVKEREKGLASVGIGVFDGQQTLSENYFGYANRKTNSLADSQTVYEWGSVSKLLVWASVMQLNEQGLIDLEADITTYLRDSFLTKTKWDNPITMTHLMNHTAGWQEISYGIEVTDKADITDLETSLKESEPPQIYQPGEVTAYSNWGAALAALIIEKITGMDYADYVKQNILEPLGMTDTAVKSDWSDNKKVEAKRKELNSYSVTLEGTEDYGQAIAYVLLYPIASTISTLQDLMTFGKALVTEDSPLFQNKDTLTKLLSATSYYGTQENPTKIERNAHGLWTLQFATTVKGHGGNTKACSTTLFFDEKTKLGTVVMTNEIGETSFCYGILSHIYGDYVTDERQAITTNISGIYTARRTFLKGFTKVFNLMGNLYPISTTDKKSEYKLSMGQGKVSQLSQHELVMDDENGFKTFQYAVTMNGQDVIQNYTSDYLKEKPLVFWGKVLLLVLLLIACLLSAIVTLLTLVSTVVNRVRRKPLKERAYFRGNQGLLAGFILIAMFILYFLILAPMETGELVKGLVRWQCLVLGLLSVVPLYCTIYQVLHRDKYQRTKWTRFGYYLLLGSGWIVTINIWYWQFYNFWIV